MNVIHKKSWAIPEREATPEATFWNRRKFMTGIAGGALAVGALTVKPGQAFAEEDPSAGLYPLPRNEAFTLDR